MNNAQIAKARALMDEAREILETVRDDEQEAFDNMPESLQNSERGEISSAYIDALETGFRWFGMIRARRRSL